jgi:hypothetical protein
MSGIASNFAEFIVYDRRLGRDRETPEIKS